MRILAACLFLVAGGAAADAAVKVQEGSVDQWIEYYARERGKAAAAATPAPSAQEAKSSAGCEADRKQ